MNALRFIVTRRGREALVNAEQNGTTPVLARTLGLTAAVIEAHPELLALPGEHTRLESLKGGATSADTIHVTARDATDANYTVRGIGLYLDDGTLFAVYGQQAVLAEKSTQAVLLLATDLQFADIAAADITFGDTNFQLNVGTEEVPGALELATPAETVDGTDAGRAVHPKGLQAALDSRLGVGAPTEVTKRLIAAATDKAVRELLGLKSASLKDEGSGNGLDADLLDGKHGFYYLAWENMTGVPASTHIPGQVITFAGTSAPSGTLLCDGREVLRNDYPQLFAAIGTTYGEPSDPTRFKLPAVDEDCVVIHTSDPDKVGQASDGAVINHTHAASTAAGGRHAHSASSGAAGDHNHRSWTDEQGYHGHEGSTTWGGDHNHTSPPALIVEPPFTGGYARGDVQMKNNTSPTGVAGGHGHAVSVAGSGVHGHNIGMDGAGNHSHTVSVSEVGDHTHATTVEATGNARNLAAGIRMLYCIVH